MPPDGDGAAPKVTTPPAQGHHHACAWLWQNKEFSDVTLLVYPAGDDVKIKAEPGSAGAASKPQPEVAPGKPEPLAQLPLHASVLASVSPGHFRGHLLRLRQDKLAKANEATDHVPASGAGGAPHQGTDAHSTTTQPPAKRAKVAGPQAAGDVLELTCFPGEPVAVAEAVLHHAYTGALPDDPALLAWMIWRADYLDVQETVKACLVKLAAMGQAGKLTMQHLLVIISLPALQTGNRAEVEQQVAQMEERVLSSRLTAARHVLEDQQVLEQFVQLPFRLLKQWATADSLVVDSENTVAVLFTAWYDHQLSSAAPPASRPTEQQCKELSALICLDKLSPSFHLQAMPHLKWYHSPTELPEQHVVVRVLAGLDAAASHSSFQTALARGGGSEERTTAARPWTKWQLTRQQVQALWATTRLELGSITFAGYVFNARLKLAKPVSGGPDQELDIFLYASWPRVLIKHLGAKVACPVTAVRADYVVATAAGNATGGSVMVLSNHSLGWGNVLRRGFSSFEDLASFAAPGVPKERQPDQPTNMSVKLTLSGIH